MIVFGLSTPYFLLFDEVQLLLALSFGRCDWLFPLSAREVSPGNRSNYKSTRERVDWEMEAPFDRLLSEMISVSFSLFLYFRFVVVVVVVVILCYY